jgi:hypothetical protein
MSRNEKRKFKRVPVNFDLLYKVQLPAAVSLKLGDIERPAIAQDISEGGMGLLTNFDILPGALLKIKFSITNENEPGRGKTQNFELDVQVCYCIRAKNAFRLGVSFVNIVFSDRLFISNYIKTGCSTRDPN